MNQNVRSQLPASRASDPLAIEGNAYAKVFRRVVPFIMICYVVDMLAGMLVLGALLVLKTRPEDVNR